MASEGAIWNTEGTAKREAVREMFGRIAPNYDLLNSLMSFRRHNRWRAQAVDMLQLRPGDSALDVCCGTGDFIAPLRRAVGHGKIVALDFCAPMLDIAKQKGAPTDALLLADACALPIASQSFNGVTVGWGIRNVPDIDAAHREIFRVLKPGGRFVSLDMALPENGFMRFASSLFCMRIVPAIGAMFGQKESYTYLPKSTEKFLSRQGLIESMQRAGLVECGWKNLMFGNICIHWGRRP